MKIPTPYTTLDKIHESISERASNRSPRNYMGLSGVGEECARKLWYSYKMPKPITDHNRQKIFDAGNMYEDLVVKWLKESGLSVYEKDDNGEQFGGSDGVLAYHTDGVVMGLVESSKPHLLEIKSAKSSRFKEFVNKGCRGAEIKYYVQCQTYMYYEGLERAYFVVINKDTQELYAERIQFNRMEALYYINRAKETAAMETEPDREYKTKAFFKCKFCDYSEECWK